jgi:hypothetical protein
MMIGGWVPESPVCVACLLVSGLGLVSRWS